MLRKSVFEDVGLLVSVLETLAGPYRDSRLPGRSDAAKSECDRRCAALGVDIAPTMGAGMNTTDPQLSVYYEDRRYFFDTKVKRGVSKDRRTHLRVYFAWDDVGKRVLVGHLPEHIVDRNSR